MTQQIEDQIKKQAVKAALDLFPKKAGSFVGSQYSWPVYAALRKDSAPNLPAIKEELIQMSEEDVKHVLEPLLLTAELYESSRPDRKEYFLTDRRVQDIVFMGSKWQAGWTLLLGGDEKLVQAFQDEGFKVFTDLSGIDDTVFIGERDTSPIYFLQLMVRYGMVWGGIRPGDDHQLGHYLEKDMPGLMVIAGDLPPLKYALALGLMKMGAPAVVPFNYPFPYGNTRRAGTREEILNQAQTFPNLRKKYYKDEVIALPEFCDPAWQNESFEKSLSYGGSLSFFCLRKGKAKNKTIITEGEPEGPAAVLIEADHKDLSLDITLELESTALRSLNYLQGSRALRREGRFFLECGPGITPDPQKMGEAIYWGTRLRFPRLKDMKVQVLFNEKKIQKLFPEIEEYRKTRKEYTESMTEQNTKEFCACTECRPFSRVHTCIVTPNRLPMCSSRTYFSLKAEALFGLTVRPYQRQSEQDIPLRTVFHKGNLIDPEKGEYRGSDRMYKKLTRGRLKKVHLHSLRTYPPTSCGCFTALAFWIPELNGIGIMERDSPARAPDGRSWSDLANHAGGKQQPGITGVSLQYIRSPDFLKGDGGIGNVVWVDSGLYEKIRDRFQKDQKVATEKEVSSVEELTVFVGRKLSAG
jgi:acetyl-CoA decarbonylase/synthase complex subunit beta